MIRYNVISYDRNKNSLQILYIYLYILYKYILMIVTIIFMKLYFAKGLSKFKTVRYFKIYL
jgi:nitrogen fixation/metabolism regulation signal transduction histidine kinase